MRLCVGNAGFHQPSAVALALVLVQNPKAVYIDIIVADYRHPRALERRIFNEHARLFVELSENMSLTKAVSEPRALCLDTRVRLLRADDAAKMLAGDILGCDIDKSVRHNTFQKNKPVRT